MSYNMLGCMTFPHLHLYATTDKHPVSAEQMISATKFAHNSTGDVGKSCRQPGLVMTAGLYGMLDCTPQSTGIICLPDKRRLLSGKPLASEVLSAQQTHIGGMLANVTRQACMLELQGRPTLDLQDK